MSLAVTLREKCVPPPPAAGEGGIEPARPDQQLDHAYQQGRADHIGTFPQLEDQMANLTSDIDRAAVG